MPRDFSGLRREPGNTAALPQGAKSPLRRGATCSIVARASRNLRSKIDMLAAGGLGAYVYWYPSIPLRVFQSQVGGQLAAVMSKGWLDLAARLLRAGFLPTTAYSIDRGHCCGRRNAVVDGGFADLGSVAPISEISAAADVFIALQMTIWSLADTILFVLGREGFRFGAFDYVTGMVLDFVRTRLMRACGAHIDPRVKQFFSSTENMSTIIRLAEIADSGL